MRSKKTVIPVLIVIAIIVLLSTGWIHTSQKQTADSNVIYVSNDTVNYKIYTNYMMDTYIIASALYLDFNSSVLLPYTESHEIYKKAKEYFSPYKEHHFIKNFNAYVNYEDINGDVIGILLSCSNDPSLTPIHDFDDKYLQGVFKDLEVINAFLTGLKAFYEDTHAEDFFMENAKLYTDMNNYILKHIDDTQITTLISNTEAYLGTKEKYFGDSSIEYETVLTLFRPSMASFYSLKTQNGYKIVTYQSPNDFTQNPYKYDIDFMVESAIHEYLHSYINKPVAEQREHINALMTNIDKKIFMKNPMYQGMPYHRIFDEYFVRAIEGRIYKETFDEKKALNTIIHKEVEYGGFNQLMGLYQELDNYEENRDTYTDMDTFLPSLIDLLAN
ncbi:DUF4932 domain-containing protein [Vallitalea okinawensis]|uniref:DUF4932 domain-containing protein n=1 Tax=Vallitalea okinawensis TaxID=2078660 RepID=UPI000CFDD489|nr:DUF4932 domain-containing protein [Vallitalea okinawensis]